MFFYFCVGINIFDLGMLESLTSRKISVSKLDVVDTFGRSFFEILFKNLYEKNRQKTEKIYDTKIFSKMVFVFSCCNSKRINYRNLIFSVNIYKSNY